MLTVQHRPREGTLARGPQCAMSEDKMEAQLSSPTAKKHPHPIAALVPIPASHVKEEKSDPAFQDPGGEDVLRFPTQTALDWGHVNVNNFNCTAWVDLNYLSLGADQSSGQERGREGKRRGGGKGERKEREGSVDEERKGELDGLRKRGRDAEVEGREGVSA